MTQEIRMSLAFNWEKPPNLLYSFHQVGNNKPLRIVGRSLSTGSFLIDPPITEGGALFSFSLYEWGGVDVAVGGVTHAPRMLKITSGNFEYDSLFSSVPTFSEFPKPESVPNSGSPFPGLSHLVRWSTPKDMARVFQVQDLSEPQNFSLSANTIVVPHPEDASSKKVRSFSFDPEMVVGTDGIPSDPSDPDGAK